MDYADEARLEMAKKDLESLLYQGNNKNKLITFDSKIFLFNHFKML